MQNDILAPFTTEISDSLIRSVNKRGPQLEQVQLLVYETLESISFKNKTKQKQLYLEDITLSETSQL